MKILILLLFYSVTFGINGQEVVPGFDTHTWEAPYHLPVPEGWTTERFPIPISFAPEIPYSGVEDIRFSPGWGNPQSEEYWTYAILWYLDSMPEINSVIISDHLIVYFSGLIKSNIISSTNSHEVSSLATASFIKTPTDIGDHETFMGSIEMLDYMQQKPILLNCIVHLRDCQDNKKTIVFFELSPQPFSHKNWSDLNHLWSDFRCNIE